MFLVAEKKRKKKHPLSASNYNKFINIKSYFILLYSKTFDHFAQTNERTMYFIYLCNFYKLQPISLQKELKFRAIKSGFPTQVDYNCMQLQPLEFPAIPRYGIPKRNTK